jgi:hypothetical protein
MTLAFEMGSPVTPLTIVPDVKIHPPKKFPSSSNWYVIMLLLDDDPTQCTFASTTFCKWTPSG